MVKNSIKILLILFIAIFFWSVFIEPNLLAVRTYNLKMSELQGLKIVFVSDFHVKKYQKYRLRHIVNVINEQNPDLIISTGDFVSGHHRFQSMQIKDIANELSNLRSKYGTYAVLGNHDWWQGGEVIGNTLESKGITVLGNENITINIEGKKLYLAGVEDITTRNIDIVKALNNVHSPSILLTHSPDVFPFVTNKNDNKITGSIDLTLAGHTHGGQVVIPFVGPIVVPSAFGKKYASGEIIENGRKMFVTKGLGTSILPIRFNCIPEIVVIDFV